MSVERVKLLTSPGSLGVSAEAFLGGEEEAGASDFRLAVPVSLVARGRGVEEEAEAAADLVVHPVFFGWVALAEGTEGSENSHSVRVHFSMNLLEKQGWHRHAGTCCSAPNNYSIPHL